MKQITIMFTLLLAVVIFISNEAFSAWTQPKGHSYNQLTFSYYKTTKKYTTIDRDDNENITTTGADVFRNQEEEFSSTKITYYGEYGITDKLTIFTTIPYDWQRSNDTMKFANEDGPSGVGDINLGLRYHLVPNLLGSGVLMSVQGTLKIPEAYDFGDPATELSLGNGQYDATIALLFGRGLGKGYAWANVGYKFRFENDEFEPQTFDPSDQIVISFGGGYAVNSWLSIRGLLQYTGSVGNAKVSDELVAAHFPTGTVAPRADAVIIKDSLGIEPTSLSGGVDLAFNVASKMQVVLSYNRDLAGIDNVLETQNSALGETLSLALVYMH